MFENAVMKKVTKEIKELGIAQYQAEDVINNLKAFYGAVKNKNYNVAMKLWRTIDGIITEELKKRQKAQ